METKMTIKIIQKRSPGRETKIGLIAPGGGKVNEEEFPLLSPPHISVVIAALGMGNQRIDRVVAPPLIENAAKTLASAGAEMILMCGIPVVFFQPVDYEQEIISRIEKASPSSGGDHGWSRRGVAEVLEYQTSRGCKPLQREAKRRL